MVSRVLSFIGFESTPHGHADKLVSGLGGFVSIAVVLVTTTYFVGPSAAAPVVTSIGASAVLLFAAPHGPLSQPWPLVMGHLLSATIGVTCARYIDDPYIAAAAAVGGAITAMYYTRSVHPPGGATALTAVLGGEALRRLGYGYVLFPVAVNVASILVVAVAFNYLFSWRRYPAAIAPATPDKGVIHREDWTHALEQLDSLADVTEDDLAKLHQLAARAARERHRAIAARARRQSSSNSGQVHRVSSAGSLPFAAASTAAAASEMRE